MNPPYPIIKHHRAWRRIEMIPGILTWCAFTIPITLSIFKPEYVAIFIIIYTTFWFFRSIKLSFDLILGYRHLVAAEKTPWNDLLSMIENPEKLKPDASTIHREIASRLTRLKTINQYKRPSEILHAILFITYKEPYEVVRQSIASYAQSSFPTKQMILVFSGEEADRENALAYAQKAQEEFGAHFKEMLITIHPKNLENEIPGKAANATWGGRVLQKHLDAHDIPYENVILSNFDADTVVHPHYFSELTYRYLLEENRAIKTYQPTHFFHNNIWDVPTPIRLMSLSCSFLRLAESMNPHRYMNFSSRSMGMQCAVDSEYWDPAIIPEDSRQYWTSYLLYGGENELVRVFTPIYMDAVQSPTWWQTFKDQYKQLRRWSWGVTDFPFVVINLWKRKDLPWHKRFPPMFRLATDHFYWATTPILLTFTGWLPDLLNPGFRDTVLAYNAPRFASTILNFAAIGIIISAIISLRVVPKRKNESILRRSSLALQWILVPLVSIFLSAIPAIESQTRLILNKRLDYQVTSKMRKSG